MLAKHGFVILNVDTFESGERNVVHGKISYYDDLKGAALPNIAFPLMGIQVIDNTRGIDLLTVRPSGKKSVSTVHPAATIKVCGQHIWINGSKPPS